MALLCTLIFEFVPNFIGIIINLLAKISTTAYAGPYWTFSSIINIFICNFMYSKAILKQNIVNHIEVVD
uniref:Uncharacterized protein n=1 Tax=Panagrolaimus sp. PS1159 TaxID=55785 RepID=A0AC35FVU1_9BILA